MLIAVGSAFVLPPLGIANASSYLFLALGIAFAVAYVTSLNPYVYLVPAATLLGLGLGLLIPDWLGLKGDLPAIVFLSSLAVSFAAAFLIRPQRRWPLAPAALLAIVAVAEVFGTTVVPPGFQPFFMPVVLIAVGAYLIVGPRVN